MQQRRHTPVPQGADGFVASVSMKPRMYVKTIGRVPILSLWILVKSRVSL